MLCTGLSLSNSKHTSCMSRMRLGHKDVPSGPGRDEMQNYYKFLQVAVSADQDIVEAGYKQLAREYHPDINRTADATAKMQEIIPRAGCLCQPSHSLLKKQQ